MKIGKTRYIPLIDEIKNHVFQWAMDDDWKSIPGALNTALTTVMNELKIHESLKAIGQSDSREESSEKQSKIDFIAVFKQKYLEYTDFNYREPITPTQQVILSKQISRLNQEGTNSLEFLEWFFDEFASNERNKQYMPPTMNFITSNFIIDKYLFLKKDTLKLKKKNIENAAARNLLLGIAVSFLEEIKDKSFSEKVLAFSREELTLKKFSDLIISYADKYNKPEIRNKVESAIGFKK